MKEIRIAEEGVIYTMQKKKWTTRRTKTRRQNFVSLIIHILTKTVTFLTLSPIIFKAESFEVFPPWIYISSFIIIMVAEISCFIYIKIPFRNVPLILGHTNSPVAGILGWHYFNNLKLLWLQRLELGTSCWR